MALDLTGIENVEFYSGHYLDAVLEGDLRGLFDGWKKAEDEDGTKAPYKGFNPVASAWEKARKLSAGEPDPIERWAAARAFHAELIEALGYPYTPDVARLEDDTLVPLLCRVERDGRPYLWIVDAPFPLDESTEALDAPLLREQYPPTVEGTALQVVPRSTDEMRKGEAASWRELLDEALFRLDAAPRWILFLGGNELLLAERHKWPAGRFLRFDLGALFARRDSAALRAFCALAHREALAPADGGCLHDTLEEKSHKHAYAVSGDLKHGVRHAIELLANEAVWYRREVQRKGVFGDPDLAGKLKDDCLTYMYRLLFLFYVEARGSELGIVPMRSDAYRAGYSLEALRDLELVRLETDESRNGYYIDQTLKTLFRLVNGGFGVERPSADLFTHADEEVMRIPALRSPLFDDGRLQVLGGVKFRNRVLQEVIRQLSLSAEKRGRQRGRISYAQLGISQLGSVYESLLSYTGFFADDEDGLYEVAARKDVEAIEKARQGRGGSREDVPIYFVPGSQIDRYDEAEFVRDEHGRRVRHAKGTFVYALAGRSREKSASFYTPEVLTQCVVKYALKELLLDESGAPKLSAAELLDLTICEPAMGSGAFLIEAVDQLADAYLERRQAELDEVLPADRYQQEKRRVKARLATNNVYGVDLNAVAVRLAQVSLWLGAMSEGTKCPWFGLRLAHGNSLIGARREVFPTAQVTRKGSEGEPNWLGLLPEVVPLFHGEDGPAVDAAWRAPARPKSTIYHFLLPAEGMAAFDKDKVVQAIEPEHAARIAKWRKAFTQPFSQPDAARLERLSDAVDRLWAEVVRERHLAAAETTDRVPVWGDPGLDPEPAASGSGDLYVQDQEAVARALEDSSSAYRRLKLVMDAWCALWFWPIERSAELPTRQEWLASLELVLLGKAHAPEVRVQLEMFDEVAVQRWLPMGAGNEAGSRTMPSFETESATAVLEKPEAPADAELGRLRRLKALSSAFGERWREYAESCGLADVDLIVSESPWLRTVEEVRAARAFHHWELRFAEVYAARGGFDLILGNPPWIKLQWQEGGILAEFEPLLALRKQSASNIAKERARHLETPSINDAYLAEFVEMEGSQGFLNAVQNEPLLRGMQTNLYKCFLTRAWRNGSPFGATGFLHPEGVYDDPKGGQLRSALYPRLAAHYQFINEGHLFPEVHNLTKYSVNIYRSTREEPSFVHASNLINPTTIARSWAHDGHGEVPGIKTGDDRFETRGHRSRLVSVASDELALFASLYDAAGTDPLEARLPVVHSQEIVHVLRRFANQSRKLGDLKEEYFATVMFDETYAQRDGTIRRETRYPADASEWILQGPHFFVGTPFNKTPNEVCETNRAYTSIDLTAIPDDYLPRTNYVPACDPAEYARLTPKWKGRPITEFYRHAHRRISSPTGERTLISTLIPPGTAHVHPVMSFAFSTNDLLLGFSGLMSSVPLDFLIKSTGKGDIYESTLASLPLPLKHPATPRLKQRILRLSALTDSYATLWRQCGPEFGSFDGYCSPDRRLEQHSQNPNEWHPGLAFRSDLTRRQVIAEMDVLASFSLDLSIDKLLTIYRVQFPVLQQYERERFYDQHGRLVPISTTAGGNPAVNLVELARTLKDEAGLDINRGYAPREPATVKMLGRKVKLSKTQAEILDVPQRCTVGDLMTTTTVRYWDDVDGTPASPEGRPVELIGLRYTDPGLEPLMERVYPTPWTRCDREEDYRIAWAEFERRFREAE